MSSAATVHRKLEGKGIGRGDSLIAGIALTQGVPFWTRNRKHFERVEGLRLVEDENYLLKNKRKAPSLSSLR